MRLGPPPRHSRCCCWASKRSGTACSQRSEFQEPAERAGIEAMGRLSLVFLVAGLCVAQTGWEIATTLPGVDLVGLTNSQREIALQTMRAESCTCGCAMKIAQCRDRLREDAL